MVIQHLTLDVNQGDLSACSPTLVISNTKY